MLYEQLGATEKSVAAFRHYLDKAPRQLNNVYCRLGLLYEKLENYEEAQRIYSRGIDLENKARARYGEDFTDYLDLTGPDYGGPGLPSVLQEKMQKKIGKDYFLKKFLGGRFAPLTREEEDRAKHLFDQLRADSLIEREEALVELQRMGPNVTPILKVGLDSSDPEVRSRTRELLGQWAEPKATAK